MGTKGSKIEKKPPRSSSRRLARGNIPGTSGLFIISQIVFKNDVLKV